MTGNQKGEDPSNPLASGDNIADYEGGRPTIATYSNKPKFRINEWVYVSSSGQRGLRGPYLIAQVLTNYQPPKYILCHEDGSTANEGVEVDEPALRN
ncbi:hypothetical protein NA56DRAFT_652548 [Hyaloscypha hepaticicola]|uniref:Uncharacterized protein n=1 Tax=Hyaloscypha hepaticicola TaxID=2082293 RepID=A0A2J6PEE8_9HELO|nr:hypothetical protein NA56DRAFT_652548 [Hyaloscypha hepaticicola]